MMSPFATIALLATAAVGAPPHSPRPPSVSLVEAQLTKVEDITGQPGVPCFCDENGRVMFDGSFRLSFTPISTLSGPRVRYRLFIDQASARPREGGKYLIVISHEADDNIILSKNLLQFGLCMENEDIIKYGLSEEAQKFPCRH